MKKLFLVILAFVHITTSTGAVVNLHYCMGELDDWVLITRESKTCGKCGMEELAGEDNGCCRNELKVIKNDTDQKITTIFFQLLNIFAQALPAPFCEIPSLEVFTKTNENPISRALLKTSSIAVYIRNCVFLI